ncbi:MAG: S8 family serine peptidase [Micropruina sp.]
MRRGLARRLSGITAASALALALAGGSVVTAAAAPGLDPNSDGPRAAAGIDKASAMVKLSGAPLATSTKVDRSATKAVKLTGTNTKNYRATLAKQRSTLRAWLKSNAPKAKITGEYDFALNAVAVRLNGTSLATLRNAPGVTYVGYQNNYAPTAADPDLARIDGLLGWAAAGATSVESDPSTWAGFGVKVAIIDTGVDATHPCFDDTGFPSATQLGDTRFTNNKVIVAKVFNNKLNQSRYSAQAIQDHGTHVAGTVACNLETPAVVQGADIPYDPTGVAPGALIGNYSVFPGDVLSARTEDILNAMQAAAEDGMHVINMSLGGGAHGVQDLGTLAVDNLDRAGIVVAVSAGNEGPGPATIGSPGSAERALSAGASSVGHYVGVPILSAGSQVSVAAIGDFPTPSADLTAPLGVVKNADGTLSTACAALPSGSLTGKIALISRGTCTFGNKVFNAEQAGAVGAILVNNVLGDPISMASDAAFTSTIYAVMSPLTDRAALMALDGADVTISSDKAYVYSGNNDILAGFSSRGPVDVSYRVKPDVVAPGVNVLSSIPQAMCAADAWVNTAGCWAFFQGTSMAAPHLAGMAAVVRAAHPSWAAWQVRSAIINTAKETGVMQSNAITTPETNVQFVGSGLADLDASVDAELTLSQPSVSFGAVPGGSGQTLTRTVTVTNVSGSPLSVPVSVTSAKGPGSFTVSAASLDLAAGASTTLTITFKAPKGAAGASQAHLYLGDVTHAVLYGYSS